MVLKLLSMEAEVGTLILNCRPCCQACVLIICRPMTHQVRHNLQIIQYTTINHRIRVVGHKGICDAIRELIASAVYARLYTYIFGRFLNGNGDVAVCWIDWITSIIAIVRCRISVVWKLDLTGRWLLLRGAS